MTSTRLKINAEQSAFIKNNCTLQKQQLHAQFCQTFNRSDLSPDTIYNYRKRQGWLTGRTGRYQKGNTPHPNAGAKGANKTSFKQGQPAHNSRPMYSERVTTDGYVEVKIPERDPYTQRKSRFKLKHIWVWEQINGPLPAGCAIVFKDGIRTHCQPGNLMCVKRGVLALINKKYKCSQKPLELRETILKAAELEYYANKKQKNLAQDGRAKL